MAKKKTADHRGELSFENSFKELQEIVARLEDGHLSLGDALQNYEQGIKRLQECYRALDHAEKKIEKLSKLRADGTFEAVEFETTGGNPVPESGNENGNDELF